MAYIGMKFNINDSNPMGISIGDLGVVKSFVDEIRPTLEKYKLTLIEVHGIAPYYPPHDWINALASEEKKKLIGELTVSLAKETPKRKVLGLFD